jgi:uncharacterized protein YukE
VAGAERPSALAPFAYDWVGGDIHGLSAFAGKMYDYVPEINGVTTALDKQVSRIVGDAGWQGSAATAFANAWGRDSLTGQALGAVIANTGSVVNWLAVELSRLENALEQEADQAAAHGVKIGSDGQPGAAFVGPPSTEQQAEQQAWASAYQKVYAEAMALAQQARQTAASQLMAIYSKIAPPPSGMTASDGNTVADLLSDLWAVPSAYRRSVDELIVKLRGQAKTVLREAAEAKADGGPLPENILDESAKVRAELGQARTDLASASENETALSKLLDTRVGDLPSKLSGLLGKSSGSASVSDVTDAADDDGLLGKLVDFGEDLPVVDVLAAAVGAGLGAYSDVEAGQAWYEAVPEEIAANGAGVAAGAVAGTAVAGGLAAGALAGAPLLAGAAGVLAGGVVAFGVGDLAHNLFEENWGADIHRDGVALGIAAGVGHSFENTGKDAAHLAEHVWDSIF